MRLAELIKNIGRPCSFHPGLAHVVGGVKACLFLENFIYWDGKADDPDGWVYKTREELRAETGLSFDEQVGARNTLKQLGLLEEKNRRIEHKLYYRVDLDRLQELWEQTGGLPISRNGVLPTASGEKPVSGNGFFPLRNSEASLTTSPTTSLPTGSSETTASTPAKQSKDTPAKPKRSNWAGDQFPNLKTICPNIDTPAGCKMLNSLAKQYGGQSIVEEALVRLATKGPFLPSLIWGALHNTCKDVVTQRATIKPAGRAEPSAGNSRRQS